MDFDKIMWPLIALGLFCLLVFAWFSSFTMGPPPGYKTESFDETVRKINKLNKIPASAPEGSSSSRNSGQPRNTTEPESTAP